MEKLDKVSATAMHIINNAVYGNLGDNSEYMKYIERCKLIDHRTKLINKLIDK